MDEVYGRGASSSGSQPDPHGHNNCDECAESGNIVTASGLCEKCTDFLCTSCIELHKKARSSRKHNILEGKDMPTIKPRKSNVEKCAMHPGRPIEAYCPDDDTFGCSLCFTVGHRSCQNISLLSDLSRGVETSKELLDVQNAADRYKKLEEEYRQVITKYLSKNDEWHSKTLERFQQFRSEVLRIVEEIGIKVHEEADALKEENKSQLNKLAHQIATYTEQVKQYMLNMDDKKDRKENEQLFIDLKKTGRLVIDSVPRLETIYRDIAVKKFEFVFDPSIKDIVIRINKINVETPPLSQPRKESDEESNTSVHRALSPATRCKSTSQLNIKSKDDHTTCWVTSIMELSETKLIMVDYNNACLKVFDMTSSSITESRSLTAKPWDITKVPGCRVVVSFPNAKQIQIFKADQTLEPCGSIYVPSGCYGLHCTGDRLIVSNNEPPKVLILSITGKVLQTIQHDPSGKELFRSPWHLTVNHDNKLIYVSDYHNRNLTCMTTTGVVQWVYRDEQLKGPYGMTTGENGSIYLCSWSTNTIHVVSRDGIRLAILQCGKYPYALYYTRNNRTLYVSNYIDDHITRLSLQ